MALEGPIIFSRNSHTSIIRVIPKPTTLRRWSTFPKLDPPSSKSDAADLDGADFFQGARRLSPWPKATSMVRSCHAWSDVADWLWHTRWEYWNMIHVLLGSPFGWLNVIWVFIDVCICFNHWLFCTTCWFELNSIKQPCLPFKLDCSGTGRARWRESIGFQVFMLLVFVSSCWCVCLFLLCIMLHGAHQSRVQLFMTPNQDTSPQNPKVIFKPTSFRGYNWFLRNSVV